MHRRHRPPPPALPPRRRLAALLLALGAAAACTPATPQAFDTRMAGFVGGPEAAVVTALGVPNRTHEIEGRRLLQYEWLRPSPAPTIVPSIGVGFGGGNWGGGWGVGTGIGLGFGGAGVPTSACTLIFESREGVITGFNRSGPGCVMAPASA